jgi:hypothetical protein
MQPSTHARKIEFVQAIQADLACPVPSAKIIRFVAYPNQQYIPRRPASQQGRFAIVTSARRDAVDALALLTNGA